MSRSPWSTGTKLSRWTLIDKALGLDCPDPAETYSNSPHLYEELGIATDVKGSIGKPKKAGNRQAGTARTVGGRAQDRAQPLATPYARGGKTATGRPGAEPAAGPRRPRVHAAGDHAGRRRLRRPRKPGRRSLVERGLIRPAMVRPERRALGGDVRATQVRSPSWSRSPPPSSGGPATPGPPKAARPPPRQTVDRRQDGARRAAAAVDDRQPRTSVPVVASSSMVTGASPHRHRPRPGHRRGRLDLRRDRELCGVTWIYSHAVAVYPDARGCGQVSTIDGATGKRGPTRSGYADKRVTLSSNGTEVLSAGDTRLETWRSDMVRVIGFGEVDARVKPPQKGIGAGCALLSAAASPATVAVMQSCAISPT